MDRCKMLMADVHTEAYLRTYEGAGVGVYKPMKRRVERLLDKHPNLCNVGTFIQMACTRFVLIRPA